VTPPEAAETRYEEKDDKKGPQPWPCVASLQIFGDEATEWWWTHSISNLSLFANSLLTGKRTRKILQIAPSPKLETPNSGIPAGLPDANSLPVKQGIIFAEQRTSAREQGILSTENGNHFQQFSMHTVPLGGVALPPKADMCAATRGVRFGSKAQCAVQ